MDGSGNPATGNVQFKDGSNVLGTSPVGSNDVATLSQTLALGVHPLTATFNPDNMQQFRALLPWMWIRGVWYERMAAGVARTGVI